VILWPHSFPSFQPDSSIKVNPGTCRCQACLKNYTIGTLSLYEFALLMSLSRDITSSQLWLRCTQSTFKVHFLYNRLGLVPPGPPRWTSLVSRRIDDPQTNKRRGLTTSTGGWPR